MRCPSCGEDNAAGLRFCKRCWRSFDDVRPEAEHDAPPPKPQPKSSHGRRPLFGVPYADEDASENDGDEWVAAPPGPVAPVAARVFAEARYAEPDRAWTDGELGPSPRAVLSFVLGLLSIVLFCLYFITIPIDLSALVLGLSELKAINGGVRPRAGRGFAVAGVVLSTFALVIKVFLLFAT